MDPTYIGLASFLTLALGLVTISNSDDSDASDDAPPDEPVLSDDDGQTLTGTDGDDVLVSEGSHSDGTGPSTILGGAGDDLIEGDVLEVRAGEGDDTVRIVEEMDGHYGIDEGDDLIVYGDVGDDLIVVDNAAGAAAYGGDGNDTIEFNQYSWFSSNTISAGAGDDLISVSGYFNNENGDRTPTIELGEGADTLNWDVGIGGFHTDYYGHKSGAIGLVSDFNSDEDVLNVNVTGFEGLYQGHVVEEDASGSRLSLSFLVETRDEYGKLDGGTAIGRATVWMPDTFGVSADAINITFGPSQQFTA